MIKFLVVDDEAGVASQLRDFFEHRGYIAFFATSGEEAIKTIHLQKPNIVVLDIIMPGMGGIETLKQIKRDHPGTRVIMLTAVDDESVRSKCVEAGASSYIAKPYNFEDILRSAHVLINEIYNEEAL